MSCTTSSLIQHVTAFRNPEANAASYNCARVALAQLGYIVTIPYAIIEAAISHIAKAFAYCAQLNPEKYEKIKAWAEGSATGILWAVHSAVVNFFVVNMVTSENQFSISVLKKDPEQPNPLSRQVEEPIFKPRLGPVPAPRPINNPEPVIEDLTLTPFTPTPNPVPAQRPNNNPQPVIENLTLTPFTLTPNPVPAQRPNPNGQNNPQPEKPLPNPTINLNPNRNRPPEPLIVPPGPRPLVNLPGRRPEGFNNEGNDDALDDAAFEALLALSALHEDKPTVGQKPGGVPVVLEGPKPQDPPIQKPVDPPKPVIRLDRVRVPDSNENIDLRRFDPGVQTLMESYKVDANIGKKLENYMIGDAAKSYTEIYDRICRELPDPTIEEIYKLVDNLRNLGVTRSDAWSIQADLTRIINDMSKSRRSPEDERFIKMLYHSWRIVFTKDKSRMDEAEKERVDLEKQAVQIYLQDADQNCKVRKNDEIQRMFIEFVAPQYNIHISPEDCLLFEFMQARTKLFQNILNSLHYDETHDRNHFSKTLYNFFYLPKPSIAIEHDQYFTAGRDTALKELSIKKAFLQCYTKTAVYNIFTGFLYPKAKEKFKYKVDTFIDWLDQQGLKNSEKAFEDEEDMTTYKTDLVIRYLEETGYLQKKVVK